MKIRTYALIFIIALAGSAFLASCLNEENRIPENCYDGIQNNMENPENYSVNNVVMVDCGGPNCLPCDHCANSVYEPWLDEEWRDCGGECEPCIQCNNGVMDGDEWAVDCGGTACGSCSELCHDGLLNGYEIEIDCVDGTDPEAAGSGCDFCPTCDDELFNGDEWGIDCGGPMCAPCCEVGNCGNGTIDPSEFNTDCGGKICPDCDDAMSWRIENENHSSPTTMVFSDYTDPILTFNSCPSFSSDEIPEVLGNISLIITGPFIFNGLQAQTYAFPSEEFSTDDFAIIWSDEVGQIYSTSQVGGYGQIQLVRVREVVVPDSDLDECNKPAGTYTYFRGTFAGVLSTGIELAPTVDCTNGSFQVTYYAP